MSKLNIPLHKFNTDECNTLLTSITEKLNIQNPQFFYPIYKKVLDDETLSPEQLRNIVFDSKFKCKEILSKVLDYDSDGFETEPDEDDTISNTLAPSPSNNNPDGSLCRGVRCNAPTEFTFKDDNIISGGSLEDNLEDNLDNTNQSHHIENILNNDQTFEIEQSNINQDDDDDNTDDSDDKEIDEAINNTYIANALIERINKQTGERIIKEEQIHIKKTALLEPLKVMKDEYVIPARIQNKHLENQPLQNTMSKLNSYNNSGHVESLFLYLGNKLVESGKCPSFPYYYGCVNGEDPNYHHNITDEYDSVSRTKWFRNRVKNDFDLLIIESDDVDEMQEQMENNLRRPQSFCRDKNQNQDDDASSNDASSNDDDYEDIEDDEDIDDVDDVAREDENLEEPKESKEPNKVIPIDAIDSALDNILEDLDNKNTTANNSNFITELNDDELDIIIEDDITSTEKTEEQIQLQQQGGTNILEDDDDFIDELSDVDPDNLSIGDFENNSSNLYYIRCDKMPVNLCLMEKLDQTLDDLLDDGYNMSENEWFSVWFQVAFGLAIAQKYFSFVHNDLHSSNVMFKETTMKYLFFQIGNNIYRIPTYGKITKIIDFARGTFKLGDRWIFSDQFKDDGDAWGQYDYPSDGTLKNCEHKPNPSFDLVRLGTTVIQRLESIPTIRHFVEDITKDDYDNSLCYDEDTFQLYIDIAHNCHNAVPIEVLNRPEFERFKIAKDKVPKGVYIFGY